MRAGHEELIATVNDTTSVLSTVVLWCIALDVLDVLCTWSWRCIKCTHCFRKHMYICEKTVYVGESGVS